MKMDSHFRDFIGIESLEEKIFKDNNRNGISPEYKKFENIDEEQKNRIAGISTNFVTSRPEKLRSQNYINVLNYLSTPYGKNKLINTRSEFSNYIPSYDEYLTFVITGCDSNCLMFTSYISCDQKLSKDEKINEVRRKVGFFSERLLKAEKDYYFKYINELLTDVTVDKTDYITLISTYVKSFDNITDERFEDIKKMALLWGYVVDKDKRYTTCIYDIIYQGDLLNLKSLDEKMVFLITAIDPELNLLKIYEEESMIPDMEQRANLELGFYNRNILALEKLYKKRFLPDINISEWPKKY